MTQGEEAAIFYLYSLDFLRKFLSLCSIKLLIQLRNQLIYFSSEYFP